MRNITTTLLKLKEDEEIEEFLEKNGYYNRGYGFYEKKYKNFRIILEKEAEKPLGWKFSIIGSFRINQNQAIADEMKKLQQVFTGFWPQENYKKEKVGREKVVEANKKVGDSFKKDKDQIQYLVSILLTSGADFIYNNDYFIAFYVDNADKTQVKLKAIKIEDTTELKFMKDGTIYFEDGEKLL